MKRTIVTGLFSLILIVGSVVNVVAAYCPHANLAGTSSMDHHQHMDHATTPSDDITSIPEVCDLGMTCTHVMSSILQQTSLNDKMSWASAVATSDLVIPHSALDEHVPPPPRS